MSLLVGGDGEDVGFLAHELGGAGAAFGEFELDVDEVGAVLAEPVHAPDGAGLFVGDAAEDEVAG